MRTKNETLGKASIGVQEYQDVARRLARPGVHLRGTAARRDDQPIAESRGELRRVVVAAAVGDDDLVA